MLHRFAPLALLATLTLLGPALGPGTARAERSPYVERVYQQALSQLRVGDLPRALQQLQRCLFMVEGDDEETFRMTLLVAVTYERMGELGNAIEMYRRFLKLTGRAYPSVELFWDDRRHEVEYTLKQLEAHARDTLSRLVVTSEPAGAAVLVDGRQAGVDTDVVTPAEVFVRPGRHVVELRAGGQTVVKRPVNAVSGATHELGFGPDGKPIGGAGEE